MRAPVLPLAVVVLALGLSGGASGASSAREAPGAVLTRLVAAAAAGDARRMWPLLTPQAQKRLGPLARFRRGTAVELAEGLGSFARGTFRVVMSRDLDGTLAVAAIAGTRRAEGRREYAAFAAPLRLVRGAWRVEVLGRVRVTPVGPDPGEVVGSATQVAAEVKAPVDLSDAAIWVDGSPIAGSNGGTSPRSQTFFGQPAKPLERGRHVVVALARAGSELGAAGWAFVVR